MIRLDLFSLAAHPERLDWQPFRPGVESQVKQAILCRLFGRSRWLFGKQKMISDRNHHNNRSIRAQPYDYALPEKQHLALIIIDMQRDFLEPGGFGEILGNDVSQLQSIVPAVVKLQNAFRESSLTVIQTKEGHSPDLSDCPPAKRARGRGKLTIGDEGPMGRILVLDEPGNAIIDALKPAPGEIVINKPGKGAFYRTDLETTLQEKQITHLVFAGVTTEVCVQSTMREANDRGYECLLVEDATASYFPKFKQATLEMVRAQGGIVGWTATVQQVLRGIAA